jgi:CubicO group peptidase (beta-lactamase class C family)
MAVFKLRQFTTVRRGGAALLALAVVACGQEQGSADLPIDTAVAASSFERAIDTSRDRVSAALAREHYPSLSTAVSVDGDLVWVEAVGYASVDEAIPASARTQYPIGSISKPLTAAAAMRLASTGVIDLDAPIETYWPQTPTHYRGVAMRQLLSHQAGVRHYGFALNPPTFSEAQSNAAFASVEESLQPFLDDSPLFRPDQSFRYSTFGYVLASRIMEEAAGARFLNLMNQTLIEPMGLASVEPNRAERPPAGLPRRYLVPVRWGPRFVAPATNASASWAGAGYVATPMDLVRFADRLQNGSFVSTEAFVEMTTPRRTSDGQVNAQRYGLGWREGEMRFPRDSDASLRFIHHGGRSAGAECALLLVPVNRATVAVCGNAFTQGGSGQLLQLAADIARDFLEAPPPGSRSSSGADATTGEPRSPGSVER